MCNAPANGTSVAHLYISNQVCSFRKEADFLLDQGRIYNGSVRDHGPDDYVSIFFFDILKGIDGRNVDKDFANRSWLAASPANCWLAAFLLALTTIVVCRTANYFPLLPVHRLEVASAYLETQGLPSSPEHATAFLNALPENWLIASFHCVRRSSITHALPHLCSLILSGLLCFYISRSLFSNVLSLLLDPVVPNFAHEMGLFERSEKMGIIRELQQQDMEWAREGEGS